MRWSNPPSQHKVSSSTAFFISPTEPLTRRYPAMSDDQQCCTCLTYRHHSLYTGLQTTSVGRDNVVILTSIHRHNLLHGHGTGSNNSGVEEYLREKNTYTSYISNFSTIRQENEASPLRLQRTLKSASNQSKSAIGSRYLKRRSAGRNI